MKKFFIIILVTILFLAVSMPVMAGGHHRYNYGPRYHGGHYDRHTAPLALLGGILIGTVVGAAIASTRPAQAYQPAYADPSASVPPGSRIIGCTGEACR